MKKLVSIVLLLVILSIGAVILGPGMVDWNKYKPEITGRLHDVTGHDYQISGNIEFGIIPAPRLKIDQLSIRMPADMGGIQSFHWIARRLTLNWFRYSANRSL